MFFLKKIKISFVIFLFFYLCPVTDPTVQSKALKYSLRATIYLAAHSNENQLWSAVSLSPILEIPAPTLAGVLKHLVKARIISSKKGKTGGFYMSSEQKAHSIIEMMHSLNHEPAILTQCLLGQKSIANCHKCPFKPEVSRLRNNVFALYRDKSIQEISDTFFSKTIK